MFEPDYSTLTTEDAIQLLKDVRELLVSIHHMQLAISLIPSTPYTAERSAYSRLLVQMLVNNALGLYPIVDEEEQEGGA